MNTGIVNVLDRVGVSETPRNWNIPNDVITHINILYRCLLIRVEQGTNRSVFLPNLLQIQSYVFIIGISTILRNVNEPFFEEEYPILIKSYIFLSSRRMAQRSYIGLPR